jgi:flagellar basal-body rod protein FlgC
MGFFSSIDISGSALTAERLRMDLIANNLANVNTTRTPQGGPYRRQMAVFEVMMSSDGTQKGVKVGKIVEDHTPSRMVYDPGHPDADSTGMVAYPNVDPVNEMIDLISATRSYEANIASINAFKGMVMKALEIGR